MYFYANDPRVPEDVRSKMATWGLAKDEFTDNGHWPHQIYVREARRMIGSFVMTENELLKRRPTPQSVGMGSYSIDSHNIQRYIDENGHVQNEGDIGVSTKGPYEIAYGALVPKRGQCDNLLVPVAVSSSHIAFGSIRMEPVFMILGQSAATAAALALDAGVAVQDVDYAALRARLLADGQVLEHNPLAADLAKLDGIVVDDEQAILAGAWQTSTATADFVGLSYRHDGDKRDGSTSARFEAKLAEPGTYEVRYAYTPNNNRATNVPVTVNHANGTKHILVNERQAPNVDGRFVSLGTFEFDTDQPAAVTVTNQGTDGHVVIDAVQWILR
jgi:hypothetical protein